MTRQSPLLLACFVLASGVVHAQPSETLLHADDTGARFGFGLSGIGDVNADGHPDFAIGAHKFDNGEVDEGKVFVYYGTGNGVSTLPNWSHESDVPGALLGGSLAGGDLNGDGVDDLAVGAFGYDDGLEQGGAVLIFFGSPGGLGATPDQTLHPDQAEAAFGRGLAIAGDLDGDGFEDLAVGAPRYDAANTDSGRADLFLGTASGVETPAAWTVEGTSLDEQFGFELAGLGDVNGDLLPDLAVTSRDGGSAVRDGHAEIFHGSAAGLSTTPSTELELDAFEARTGFGGITGGDFDGDGYDDAALGAHTYNTAEQPGGVVAIFHGGPGGLSALADRLLDSGEADAQFGIAVAGGEDLDGDGVDDLVVGAQSYPDNGQPSGAAFVYPGSPDGLAEMPEYTFTYGQAGAKAGRRVALLADQDGDGTADIAVTALEYTQDQTDEGAVFLHTGFSEFIFSDRFEDPAD